MALIGSLTSGVSSIRSFSRSIETIGDNIANANTTGFKHSRTRMEDGFSQTLAPATNTTSSVQIGSGVNLSTNRQNFTQGSLTTTGVQTDLGIVGNGFFAVKQGTSTFYTRDGNFKLTSTGDLVNSQGFNVLDNANTPINIPPVNGGSPLRNFTVSQTGAITAYYENGNTLTPATVGLTNFTDPTLLQKTQGNLFTHAGLASNLVTPGTGDIKQGTLELSNVDLAAEFSELIISQRSFQAGSRIITVSDSVLEELINLKR